MKKLLNRCSIGGWASKIGPEALSNILETIPVKEDKNLLAVSYTHLTLPTNSLV